MISSPNNIDFLKIDVEGYEMNTLKGAAWIIIRDRPLIMVEAMEATAFLESCLRASHGSQV